MSGDHNMYSGSHNPTFHHDGSITYWDDSRGWFHRVHPSKVNPRIMKTWRAQDRKKWALAMVKRGFIKQGGKWIPAHEIKKV